MGSIQVLVDSIGHDPSSTKCRMEQRRSVRVLAHCVLSAPAGGGRLDTAMGTRSQATDADPLLTARDAAQRADWLEAATILRPRHDELDAKTLEVLAEAEWWLGNLDACIDVRQEAYERSMAAGERGAAAALALKLASDYTAKLASSQAQGWHRRAIRLLKDLPEGPVHGHLLLQQLWERYRREDPQEAIDMATRAVEIAGRHDDPDLQALAWMDLGRVLLHSGKADEAMPLIEEACTAAVGGELTRHATGTVFCQAIVTFQELTDYGRASEWADAATRWCERRALKGFPGLCRVHRAEAMRLRGAWAEASVQAEQACSELVAFAPGWARGAFRELAIIRLRLGDIAGAEAAVDEARALGSPGQPSLALVCLAKGKPELALSGLQAAVSGEDWSELDRAPCLTVMVEAALLVGQVAVAESGAAELTATAARYGTPVLQAAAVEAVGRVALAKGEGAAATISLRQALQHYASLDLPYETARARVLLARAYGLIGDAALAEQEIKTAVDLFGRLGAASDAQAASDVMSELVRPRPSRAAFMFTDICGSTPLVEVLGDEAWSDLVSWHDATLRRLFADSGGEELDHAGDGFFVAFSDARSAVSCAVAIQRQLKQHRREHGFSPDVRIGIHEAEAARTGRQIHGKGVHTAARIGSTAVGGEILVSTQTLDGVTGPMPVDRRQTVKLKGLTDPVEVASIAWQGPLDSQ